MTNTGPDRSLLPTRTPRRILITGASRGIGRAAAQVLAARGDHVVLTARSLNALESVAQEIARAGGRAEVYQLDVTDPASVRAATERVLAAGPVDGLVNCAGSLRQGRFLEQTDEALRSEMELNYFGPMRMTRALLPSMVARSSGSIVNVSSILASVGTATTANYGASKAALESFSFALRQEVAKHGIHVTVFVAPHTQTELGAATDFRGVQSFPVEFVGSQLALSLDSGARMHCAGSYLRMGRRLSRWFPTFMERKLHESVAHL